MPFLSQLLQPGDPPEVMEGARRLLAGYRRNVLIALACAVSVSLVCYWSIGHSYSIQVQVALLLICSALTLRLQWRLRGLRIAHASLREACLVIDEFEQLPRWPWFAAVVVLSLAAAYLAMMWSQIPPRFPVHWDFAGKANGWSERTIWGVFRPLLIGLGAVMFLYGVQHFQRWFLRRQWSTLGQMMRIRNLLGLRGVTYSSAWVAVGSAAVAVSLPFAARLDLRIMAAAVVCYLGAIVVAALALRGTNTQRARLTLPPPR
jgi:uncharacterized membrane protein